MPTAYGRPKVASGSHKARAQPFAVSTTLRHDSLTASSGRKEETAHERDSGRFLFSQSGSCLAGATGDKRGRLAARGATTSPSRHRSLSCSPASLQLHSSRSSRTPPYCPASAAPTASASTLAPSGTCIRPPSPRSSASGPSQRRRPPAFAFMGKLTHHLSSVCGDCGTTFEHYRHLYSHGVSIHWPLLQVVLENGGECSQATRRAGQGNQPRPLTPFLLSTPPSYQSTRSRETPTATSNVAPAKYATTGASSTSPRSSAMPRPARPSAARTSRGVSSAGRRSSEVSPWPATCGSPARGREGPMDVSCLAAGSPRL